MEPSQSAPPRRAVHPVLFFFLYFGFGAPGGFLTGTPSDIIESLKKIETAYPGLSRITVTLPLGTPLSVWLEQVERFAKEVMPAFNTGSVAELAAN